MRCPECGSKNLRELGRNFFCLDCDWDNLQKLKIATLPGPTSYLEIRSNGEHCYHCDCGKITELPSRVSCIWWCRCGICLRKDGCDVQVLHESPARQWKSWECKVRNLIDFRYWFCECHYQSPYGLVIMGGCPKHD